MRCDYDEKNGAQLTGMCRHGRSFQLIVSLSTLPCGALIWLRTKVKVAWMDAHSSALGSEDAYHHTLTCSKIRSLRSKQMPKQQLRNLVPKQDSKFIWVKAKVEEEETECTHKQHRQGHQLAKQKHHTKRTIRFLDKWKLLLCCDEFHARVHCKMPIRDAANSVYWALDPLWLLHSTEHVLVHGISSWKDHFYIMVWPICMQNARILSPASTPSLIDLFTS